MTYKLPFGLKAKPLIKYFKGGSFSFSCREGKLYYIFTRTIHLVRPERYVKEKSPEKEITSKEQLNKLLSIKSVDEIQALEIINQ